MKISPLHDACLASDSRQAQVTRRHRDSDTRPRSLQGKVWRWAKHESSRRQRPCARRQAGQILFGQVQRAPKLKATVTTWWSCRDEGTSCDVNRRQVEESHTWQLKKYVSAMTPDPVW